MKNIEKDKLEKLLGIVEPYPSTHIVHFSDSGTIMINTIRDFCQKREYSYQINCTDANFYELLEETYRDEPGIKPVNFNLKRPKYMMQGKKYEYLFVTIHIEDEEKGLFLKKAHDIISNAGNILIFIPKNSYGQRYLWTALLEEHYFVATNTIDDLFEQYDVVISKKMHGWGNK